MNRSKLKTYAPQARRDFIRAMTDRASVYGLTATEIEPLTAQGDVALIGGKAFPASVVEKRQRLEERVRRDGFGQTMEAMAYTWFNRLVAVRYMELHGYLDHGYRVLSHPEGKPTPEIVEHAEHVDLPGLDRDEVIALKLDGTKEAELYRKMLIAQCNALHTAMPFLFERIADETELLLPDNLLHSDSLVRKLVTEIDEADWQEVEIIGWLYQFYISEKKDEVIGSVVKSEDIPAATQLFTPNWIVKYLVHNTLGRQWLATHPDSPLKAKMEFYIEPAEQTPEVQAQLKAITPESLNPEELTFLDPACGSGHILVEAYSLLKDIYLERGYRLRDIPKLILTKNLFGLEIDDRAAQLAAFSLLMMARADDRNILAIGVTPNILAIQQTDHLDTEALLQAFTHTKLPAKPQPTTGEFGFMDHARAPLYVNTPAPSSPADPLVADLRQLLDCFKGAKTFGSLLRVSPLLTAKHPVLSERIAALQQNADLTTAALGTLGHLIGQVDLLSRRYSCVVANPPYMGSKGQNPTLAKFLRKHYPDVKSDLFSSFIVRNLELTDRHGQLGIMCPFVWMFIGSYEKLRQKLLNEHHLTSLVQLEYSGFDGATVPICTFTFAAAPISDYIASFIRLSDFRGAANQASRTLEAIRDRDCGWFYNCRQSYFHKVPGSPIAFWLSEQERTAFEGSVLLSEIAEPKCGMNTGDNARFLRHWSEVPFAFIGFQHTSFASFSEAGSSWVPYNKGGPFRRWYGNCDTVLKYDKHSHQILSVTGNRLPSEQYYFRESLTWTKITSAFFSLRCSDPGFVFDGAGSCAFPDNRSRSVIAAFMCSKVAAALLRARNPTLNAQSGDIGALPLKKHIINNLDEIKPVTEQAVSICRRDWDTFEFSWDFKGSPLLHQAASSMAAAYSSWRERCRAETDELQSLEEANNRLFISAYNLQDELSPDVPIEQITLFVNPAYRYELGKAYEGRSLSEKQAELEGRFREDTVKEFISYAIGCAMGRYSLDKPGLIYAHCGSDRFDPAAYTTFPADKDGIIPVIEEDWFADDAAARFEEFVAKTWPAEHLDENLSFVAGGLGAKKDESLRQTIRRYLSDGFYKHHLQTYKRRPIYWLFCSGKQRAFQALVYLHRYNEGTLSRMRTEYVIPLQGKIAARIEKLEADKAKAASTSHGKGIQKEQDKLRKQQQELIAFDEKLRHYADLRINLDLDDGVKVNYRKFADPAIGEIVAEVKAVCGKDEDGD